jgi:hypothetical protein
MSFFNVVSSEVAFTAITTGSRATSVMGTTSALGSNGVLGIEEGVRGEAVGDEHYGVAVGRAVDQLANRDVARGTRLVLDHHRLPEARRDLLSHRARDDVHRAPGSEADQDPDRLGGIGLRQGRGRDERERTSGSERKYAGTKAHGDHL